jgi:hypothetical protein
MLESHFQTARTHMLRNESHFQTARTHMLRNESHFQTAPAGVSPFSFVCSSMVFTVAVGVHPATDVKYQ